MSFPFTLARIKFDLGVVAVAHSVCHDGGRWKYYLFNQRDKACESIGSFWGHIAEINL